MTTVTYPYLPISVTVDDVHKDTKVYNLPWLFVPMTPSKFAWKPIAGLRRGVVNQIYTGTGGKAHKWKNHKIGFSNYGYLRGGLEEKIVPGTVCFTVDGIDERFLDNHKGKIVLDGGKPVGIIDYQTGQYNFTTTSKVVDRIISVAYAKEFS